FSPINLAHTPAGLAKFVEEKKAPENAKQTVGIPERESDAKSDIANGKDGQRVGNCPEAARENGPDHQMRRTADVRANGRGPEYQRRKAQARALNAVDYYAGYHQ